MSSRNKNNPTESDGFEVLFWLPDISGVKFIVKKRGEDRYSYFMPVKYDFTGWISQEDLGEAVWKYRYRPVPDNLSSDYVFQYGSRREYLKNLSEEIKNKREAD